MAEIIINPTPKQEFLTDGKAVTAHRNLMQMPPLQHSIRAALAQYQRVMADRRVTEGNLAAMNHFKAQGAQEFISTLITLAESPTSPPTRTNSGNLNQKA